MTRIVLHRNRLPAHGRAYLGSPVLMCAPWKWWETRTHNTLRQDHEDATYTVTFGQDGAAVTLTDPPSVRLLSVTVYDDRLWMELDRTILVNAYLLGRVVWHEQPGPTWYPVSGLFICTPHDYQFSSEMRSQQGARGDYRYFGQSEEQVIHSRQQVLNWPITPTVRVEHVDGPTGTEVRNWGGDLIAMLQEPAQMPRYWAPRYMPTIIKGGRSPNVLPESEVIDDIDRLVNDQVRTGPVDDYSVNRYPKCPDCGHDWHGLECEAQQGYCDCLNTDWIKGN